MVAAARSWSSPSAKAVRRLSGACGSAVARVCCGGSEGMPVGGADVGGAVPLFADLFTPTSPMVIRRPQVSLAAPAFVTVGPPAASQCPGSPPAHEYAVRIGSVPGRAA
ncbi:hypothetical protein Stsp02_12400 [Streptomyces sp. NBRC 14336]|nr:hypothetical protein Stsp02_12400 [Streptomyces sp. NBRC 14336]